MNYRSPEAVRLLGWALVIGLLILWGINIATYGFAGSLDPENYCHGCTLN